jgi:sigma-B regulation protein RsbU (phosphoserine phosphatase)
MSSLRSLSIIVLLGLLGAVSFFSLVSDHAPTAAVNLKLTRSQVIDLARDYLSELTYDVTQLTADANFRFDNGLSFYLEEELGPVEAHRIIRADTIATHYWHVQFYDSKLPPSQQKHQYNVWISPAGTVRGFEHQLPDSLAIPSIDETAAADLAQTFLLTQGFEISQFQLENSTANQLVNRRDYFFRWVGKDSVYSMQSKLWLRVHGDHVGGFRHNLDEPQSFVEANSRIGTFVTYVVVGSSIATFVLLIFIITLFLKKYHDGEVGIQTAVLVFGILFAATVIEYLLGFSTVGYTFGLGDVNRSNVRILVFIMTVFIVQAFLAAMVFAAWSVGESSARRGWTSKLNAIDGLLNWKPFTVECANAVVRGYSFGFVILGGFLGILAVAAKYFNFGLFATELYTVPESIAPSFTAIFLGLRVALVNEIVFRFFFISWLREKTGKTWPGLVVSSLLWTLIAFTLWDFPVAYIGFEYLFPAYFLISVTLGFILVKYDLLTAIFTNFVLLAMSYAIPLFNADGSFYQQHEMLFYAIMSIPLIVAVIGYIKRQRFQFSRELTPSHIRRISERERMSRELEIARSVQMSLLPKENPLVEGYDIAGVCIPALEVGGDYYDFFHLGDGQIGIAIGDVSGKGVPAAIYMTLTKGILQSYASENFSPREVLNKLNRQMYSNIERNNFVSMFYAILDMKGRKIRFARAGHNPAILAHRGKDSNTFLQPKGLALGLESGVKFYEFLEEHEVALESGDVLTFYTDGFTEASTKDGEEYGEDRLEKVITENKDTSANLIIQNVVRAVKRFVGNHPQHDDMTMVVVKVQ